MDIEQAIQEISLQEDEQAKLDALERLKRQLPQLRTARKKRYLLALLYDAHWYIRQEGAFLIDQLGIPLKGEDYYRYLLALQDFENLFVSFNDPLARKIIFEALKDAHPRFRFKLFAYLKYEDCQTWREKALFWYGHADYEQLVPLMQTNPQAREFIMELLRYGMDKRHNPDYHRRRCAETLQRIEYSERVERFIEELLGQAKHTEKTPPNRDLRPVPLDDEPDLPFRLKSVIADLRENGIWVNGNLMFPQIQIGSSTNRITYRQPALQTWPKEERLAQIQPPPGKSLMAFDYIAIEPRLAIHFLLQRFLLALDDVPEEDVYLAFYPQNRQMGKRLLNTLINGGRIDQEVLQTPFAQKVARGLRELRLEQMSLARRNGYVETLAGNRIVLERETPNFAGKALNRLIQGSASDIFNEALCTLSEKIKWHNWPVAIYFVLFDEVWLALPAGHEKPYVTAAVSLLDSIYKTFNVLLPIRCRVQRIKKPGEEK